MELLLLGFTIFAFRTLREQLMVTTITRCLNGEQHVHLYTELSFPNPNPMQRRRSGDIWTFSWLCIPLCDHVLQMVLHNPWNVHVWHRTGIANVAKIQARTPAIWLAGMKTWLLTQHNLENVQLSPDPFPCDGVGSGDENNAKLDLLRDRLLITLSYFLVLTTIKESGKFCVITMLLNNN